MSCEIKVDDEGFCEKVKLHLQNSEEAALNLVKGGVYKVSKLETLNISSCELLSIPTIIFSFKYLTELNLSNNSLESIPQEIGNLYNLQLLNLSQNKLMSLPKSLRNIYQLTFLNISYNIFTEVPEVLYSGLRAIRILDLSFNDISHFHEAPDCLIKLIELRLSNNSLKELPAWIFDNLCQLQILDLNQNYIRTFTESILNYCNSGIFETLRVLNIGNNLYKYTDIHFLSHFKNLEKLYLGNYNENGIKEGKNDLGNFQMLKFKNFQSIKYLYLQNVQISNLPNDIEYLKNIEIIDLSHNVLSWLPESFCNLTSLKYLHLTANQLLFLPNDIGKLENLQQIHLGNNSLCELPESFCQLINLEFIDLYNNKIEKIDLNILRQQKLCGIDLEQNNLDFNIYECNADTDGVNIIEQYECLKKVFRQQFDYLDCRCDSQIVGTKEPLNSLIRGSCSGTSIHGMSSCDETSDTEETTSNTVVVQNGTCSKDEEDWDEKSDCVEEDEMFDPNDFNIPQQSINNLWKSDFKNNFCPASGHVRSIMRTYIRNFKLAAKNETVEGQFDSD